MSDEAVFLTFDEALEMLPDGDYIHTFTNPAPSMFVGADWERNEIIKLLEHGQPQLTGPVASGMGHGIVALDGNRFIFIETKTTR
jgi:hypothetical protein